MPTTIGIIGAMDEEIALLLQGIEGQEQVMQSGISFVKGRFHGKEVVVCKSGVGKVNAAITTQILIDRFDIGAVWFTGVAGALDPGLNIGDIVISSSCQQHDMDCSPLGFSRGIIPFQETSDFPADPGFIKLAEEACSRVCKEQGYVIGRVLSGDQFIADSEKVRLLHETMGGACVEMEGAAIGQVCYTNSVPYVILRSMSDKADGTADVNFAEFTVSASKRSFEIVEDMIRHFEAS
ncbi:5'-methylthioadenosine/adenosylhomocysteine nucleosidase [Paenibacillus vini]|uniref:adenosylhomocysteine nucleosidase n=1 Tax=Paenibacillus vini TaxID=1476024 RepID=A0ABQ4M797_9BACL|nr:5'-methylthioadenosine/adenosylhomocysteine nucleosidase [Paenibacillus vini]GIP51868.1 5'-methylthioadenosine/S-adenosylhomocysteine nucleosidase [Paenibacillus vini]